MLSSLEHHQNHLSPQQHMESACSLLLTTHTRTFRGLGGPCQIQPSKPQQTSRKVSPGKYNPGAVPAITRRKQCPFLADNCTHRGALTIASSGLGMAVGRGCGPGPHPASLQSGTPHPHVSTAPCQQSVVGGAPGFGDQGVGLEFCVSHLFWG